jgi:uncharacterized protein (DUF302 family)
MAKNKTLKPNEMVDVFGDPISIAINLLQESGYKVAKTREEVKDLAIDEGFKVWDAPVFNDRIKDLIDLRRYFKHRLWRKQSTNEPYKMEGNDEQEMRAFKLFVEARQATGLNRFKAIQECVAIIDTIFENEAEFGFDTPIDLRVIGQGKAGWITQKALFILNKKSQEKQDATFQKTMDEIEEKMEKEAVDSQKQAANKLDLLLAKMNLNGGNNG